MIKVINVLMDTIREEERVAAIAQHEVDVKQGLTLFLCIYIVVVTILTHIPQIGTCVDRLLAMVSL